MKALLCGVTVLLTVVAVGCGSDSDDDSGSVSSDGSETASAANSAAPTDPIPPVTNPRNAAALSTRPCEIFAAEQLAARGIDQSGEVQDGSALLEPSCVWTDSANNQRISATVNKVPDGLDNLYAQRGGVQVFQVIDVGGNPAALEKPLRDGRRCSVTVQATEIDLLFVAFDFQRAGTPDPCGPARELAQIAFDNLAPVG